MLYEKVNFRKILFFCEYDLFMKFQLPARLGLFICSFLLAQNVQAHSFDQFTSSAEPVFLPNKGQVAKPNGKVADEVKFYATGNNVTVYFREQGISYSLTENSNTQPSVADRSKTIESLSIIQNLLYKQNKKANPEKVKGFRLDMNFDNASSEGHLEGGVKTGGQFNFYYPRCPNGVTDIQGHKTLTYRDVYEGVDIRFYFKEGQLKYDIQVQPRGNPDKIQFNFKPKSSIQLSRGKRGLAVITPVDTLHESIPKAYQIRDGQRSKVTCQYKLNGSKKVKLQVGPNYNSQKPLTIDPLVRSWATLTGGTVNDVAVDQNSNVYLTGNIENSNLNVTFTPSPGAFQGVSKGPQDIFLSKFDSSGSRIWATYYGGKTSGLNFENETGLGVAVKQGMVAFTGKTQNSNFPISNGAYQSKIGGSASINENDAFLVVFDTAGNRKWATFFGGRSIEVGFDVAISKQGRIAFTGKTKSSNFPVTGNAYDQSYGCASCLYAYFTIFNKKGKLAYSSYFGGNQEDVGRAIDFNQQGDLAIAGQTNSSNILKRNSYQKKLKGKDAFISVLSNSFNLIEFSTLLGGTKEDVINGISFKNDKVYFGGYGGKNFPTTAHAFKKTFKGLFRKRSSVVGKISTAGQLGWSTYFGESFLNYGGGNGGIAAVSFKKGKGLHFIGQDPYFRARYPVTPDAFSKGGIDTEVVFGKFSSSGVLQYSSYYLGEWSFGSDGETAGISVDNNGNVYFGNNYRGFGNGAPSSFLKNAYKTKSGGGVAAKFSECIVDSLSANSKNPTKSCFFNSAKFTADSGYTSYRWYQKGKNKILDKDRTASFSNKGEYILRATLASGCTGYDTVYVFNDSSFLKAPLLKSTQTIADSVIKIRFSPGIPSSIFSQYTIYRKPISKNKFKAISKINEYKDTVYQDSSAQQADEVAYTYYVSAKTRCGDSVLKSNELSSIVLDTLSRTSDSVVLTWNKPSDSFSGTYRLVNDHGASPKTLGNVTDSLLAVNRCRAAGFNQITYTRQSSNGTSNKKGLRPSPAVNFKQASVKDSQRIKLEWKPFSAKSIAYGYIVERKQQSGGFQITDTIRGRLNTTYTDVFSNDLKRSQCYRIKPLDSCSNNTPLPSDTHCTMYLTSDTTSCRQFVTLNWDAYVGFDSIKQYRLYRKVDGNNRNLLGSVQGDTTKYSDTISDNRFTYRYEVVAIAANQAAKSSSNKTTARVFRPNTPPLKAVSKTVSGQNFGQVKIKWNNQEGKPKINFQKLYYKASDSSNFNLLADSLPLTQDTFIHEKLNTVDKDYRYYLTNVDSCGNESDSSIIHKTINLSVEKGNLLNRLNWTTYQGFPVQQYKVQKAVNGGLFRNLATLDGNDTTLVDSNIRCGEAYSYKIIADGKKPQQQSTSDTVIKIGFDSIPPDQPNLLQASVKTTSVNQGSIELLLNGASQANRKGYVIRYKRGGGFNPLDTILTAQQTNLSYSANQFNTADTSQAFYIQTIDSCNNISPPSDTHRTIALTAKPQNNYVQLSWSAYQKWDDRTYQIQRKQGGTAWETLTTKDSSTLSYRDSGVKCGEEYIYRIVGEEVNTSYRVFSNTDSATGFETVSPTPPELKSASVTETGSGNGRVKINWNRSNSPDAESNFIYRSLDGQNYQLLDTINGTTYTDQGLNTYNQTYYYRLKAIDSCNNISDSFSIPHLTINLNASGSEEAIFLNWTAYEGQPVKKYQVLRGSDVLYTVSDSQTFLRDEKVVCDTFYDYQVRAILGKDTSTQVLSNTDSAKATDNTAPQSVYLQRASVSVFNKVVELKWKASRAYDARMYQVYRRNNNTGKLTPIAQVAHPKTTYTDSFAIGDRELCYFVRVKDACGNVSEFSNRGCIMQLKGKALKLKNELTWPSYQKWRKGTQVYEVLRQQTDSTYKRLGTLDSSQNLFVDENLVDSADKFCYFVRAKGIGAENYSRSTRICLQQSAVVYIPNTFSPKTTSGLNDQFGPEGLYIKNYQMQIFNRWGEKVFSTNSGEQWDGTYKGKVVQPGLYHYRIKILSEDGGQQTYDGQLNVLR